MIEKTIKSKLMHAVVTSIGLCHIVGVWSNINAENEKKLHERSGVNVVQLIIITIFIKEFQRQGIERPELRERTICEWALKLN